MICEATKGGEPEHDVHATWIDESDILWCDDHALEVRRLNPGRARLRRVSESGAWWPPVAVGAAASPAFSAAICPVATMCRFCGAEILFGAGADRLEVELRLCSACPGTEEEQQAFAEGVVIGMRSGAGEEELPGESWLMFPPYPWGSEPYRAWKRGWWAGHFAARDEGQRERFALDVSMGWLRPSGSQIGGA